MSTTFQETDFSIAACSMIFFRRLYIKPAKCEITLVLAVSHYTLDCVWWSRGLWDLFWLESAARYLLLTATAAACPRYIWCVHLCVLLHMHSYYYLCVSASCVFSKCCECLRAFVSYSMHVLDGSCGFAVVVISLRVGWTNLSIQFLPLVFSPMREPSLISLHSVSRSDKTLLSEKP